MNSMHSTSLDTDTGWLILITIVVPVVLIIF